MEAWSVTTTNELISAVERIKKPATYLVDVFFSQQMPVSASTYVSLETRLAGRQLASYVVTGAHGVNMARVGSRMRSYKAPIAAARRVISLNEIESRQFGETPIVSTVTPADRAAQMQALDLADALRALQSRKNQQAAQILQSGKVTITGYADDGVTPAADEIVFDENVVVSPSVAWDQAGATIYDDLRAASERIQEDVGLIPTLAVCGRNVERYLLSNTEIFKWLTIPNRENATLLSLNPQYTSPQVRFLGYLNSLNMELVSYAETYVDDDGEIKPFVDPDSVIIGVPGRGKQLYGAVSYLDASGVWQTAAAQNVPVYTFDTAAQQSVLTVYSRFLLAPEMAGDYMCLKVRGA